MSKSFFFYDIENMQHVTHTIALNGLAFDIGEFEQVMLSEMKMTIVNESFFVFIQHILDTFHTQQTVCGVFEYIEFQLAPRQHMSRVRHTFEFV